MWLWKAKQLDNQYSQSNQFEKGLISGQNFSMKEVEYAVDGEWAIFEGDIILGTVEEMKSTRVSAAGEAIPSRAVVISATRVSAAGEAIPSRAVVISDLSRRWPGAIIPYEIDENSFKLTRQEIIDGKIDDEYGGITDPDRIQQIKIREIRDTITYWNSNTVIKLIPRTSQRKYAIFTRNTVHGASRSPVGMENPDKHSVLLGMNNQVPTYIHEVGHLVGLWHEQSREDREKFVKIYLSRTTSPGNFSQKITDGDDVGEYDYCSIMHYGCCNFSTPEARAANLPVIETLRDTGGCTIGRAQTLSQGDLDAVSTLYQDQIFDRERQSSIQSIGTKTRNPQNNALEDVVVFTGQVLTRLQPSPRRVLESNIKIILTGQSNIRWTSIRDAAACVSLGSIFNANESINTEWAVWGVGPVTRNSRGFAEMDVLLKVQDVDAILSRIAYKVTVAGQSSTF